ncbi:MAG TPA: ATP-binding cassette domain-containing protein, partial [Chromatiaceae bacterium]|nr:ATP-binding cassette domain-containing protein [Chromatiaceae bacterium]
MRAVIEVSDVVTRFGDNLVHDRVSLTIRKGEIYGLMGGSGSGKSTLLREIILLQRPESGRIRVLGKELENISFDDAAWLRQQWGVL